MANGYVDCDRYIYNKGELGLGVFDWVLYNGELYQIDECHWYPVKKIYYWNGEERDFPVREPEFKLRGKRELVKESELELRYKFHHCPIIRLVRTGTHRLSEKPTK